MASLGKQIKTEWIRELKKFKAKNTLKITKGKSLQLDGKRLAYLIVMCYITARSIVYKEAGKRILVNDTNIGALEPQIFTLAMDMDLKCSKLSCEIPASKFQPDRAITSISENGFRKVEVSSAIETLFPELLGHITNLEKL